MQHLARTILLIIIITFLLQISAAQSSWRSITDREAGFTINFPGNPTYQQLTNPLVDVPMESYSFVYNNHHLQILFWPLSDPPRTPAEATWFLNNSIQVYGRDAGTLLRQEKLPDGGRQFDNVKTDAEGTLHLRTRIYLHHGKFFSLAYSTYASEGIDERVAGQFFSSFRFITSRSSRRASGTGKQSRGKKTSVTAHDKWYTLRGAHGDFVVELPSKPSYSETPDSSTGVLLDSYICYFGENTFIVASRDKYQNEISPEQIIRGAARNAVAAFGEWQLAQPVKLAEGIYEVKGEGPVNDSPMQLRLRLYMRGSRLYFVSSFTKNLSGPNRDDLKRFFGSFHTL